MRRSGITLVELVVAITVAGLILSTGYAALSNASDSSARAREHIDASVRTFAARNTIGDWLRGAHVTGDSASSFSGIRLQHDGLMDSAVTFETSNASPFSMGRSVVELYIDRSVVTAERGLVARLTEHGSRRQQLFELAPSVAAMIIDYLYDSGDERHWLEQWANSSQLPKAVRIQLVAHATDTLPAMLRIPILVALGTP